MLSSTALAQGTLVKKRASVGVSYLSLFGDLRDSFKDGFAYSVNGMWELIPDKITGFYISGAVDYIPLKGDDIRESSSLRMLSANLGIDQNLYQSSWYNFFITVRPELSYWNVHNKLSQNYARFDSGSYWGMMLGMTNSFRIMSSWEIEFFIFNHFPRFSISNIYFDIGLRLAKIF